MMSAVIGLEDGTILKGTGFGAEGIVCGELVFTTQYTGYEESLTDPSYAGQILMFTYPLIGNYGVNDETFQSDGVKAEGLVVREACPSPSHHLSTRNIYKLMEDEGKPGISGIDTRMLTIGTREHGTMRAALINGSDDGEEAVRLAREQPDISTLDLISRVTCKEPYTIESKVKTGDKKHVVLFDLGMKKNISVSLLNRGVDVTVVPASTPTSVIEEYNPDLLFLSNGPGDPQNAQNAINVVKDLAGSMPISGICLGHQVISRALGADTYKLKFGHRGANQPVKDLESGIVHITSQNHGFAVDGDSFDGTDVNVTQINTNDNTVEGIEHNDLDIFSVQYHPEANAGPRDTEKIFFGKVMKAMGGRV
ncbi:glutamine-hydrolyzing carbamoyl-phosphate synthase small subunit [Methanococcoides methylutens]|uniref:Carbamoyl phosphate synthase small chain n=1 Tax=Methanococcoides methylutens MM1 TaxID=1434104 RepID=A0A0E3SSD6_METMT|nr:glutamine-hydrolyzing carbamoyl-phosphate synthase small subunit [Methanococcoides methylutens]AKB85423.1 Carbamoyl-phosphate synthase small chain [Methanococcoides methylutens MM1]